MASLASLSLSRPLVGAAMLAPLGALAGAFLGFSVAGQSPLVVGAAAGAAAGYFAGPQFVDFGADGYGSVKAHDVVMLASAASAGYLLAPRFGFSEMVGAGAGAAAGYALNSYAKMPSA